VVRLVCLLCFTFRASDLCHIYLDVDRYLTEACEFSHTAVVGRVKVMKHKSTLFLEELDVTERAGFNDKPVGKVILKQTFAGASSVSANTVTESLHKTHYTVSVYGISGFPDCIGTTIGFHVAVDPTNTGKITETEIAVKAVCKQVLTKYSNTAFPLRFIIQTSQLVKREWLDSLILPFKWEIHTVSSTSDKDDADVKIYFCRYTNCSNVQSTARLCSGCHMAAYCNSTCQKNDWNNHKLPCKARNGWAKADKLTTSN